MLAVHLDEGLSRRLKCLFINDHMNSMWYNSPRMFSEKIEDVFCIGLIGKAPQT